MPSGDGHAFDALALGEDRVAAAEITVRRHQVLQAVAGAAVFMVGDEGIVALRKSGREAFFSWMRFFFV